jgi:hypothetical protein
MVIFGKFMANNYLKRCPFCGGKVRISQNRDYRRLEIKHIDIPDECPMYKSWLYDTEEAAIEAWNRRATTAKKS